MTGHLKTQTGKSLGGPVLHEGYFFGLCGYGKKIIDSVFHCQRGILKGKSIRLGKGSSQSDRTQQTKRRNPGTYGFHKSPPSCYFNV
jgi:hypothetical protein